MQNSLKGIIFDYGGVISKPQNQVSVAIILKMLNRVKPEDFAKTYNGFRHEYDAGLLDGLSYWLKMLNYFGLQAEEELIHQLIEQDVRSWVTIDEEMIEYINYLRTKNLKLSILSNMCFETLDYLRKECKWLNLFDHCIFSCDIRMVKPSMEIYRYCIEQIKLKPEECLFIDDTYVNIEAAENYGIKAIHYKNLADLKERLGQYNLFLTLGQPSPALPQGREL